LFEGELNLTAGGRAVNSKKMVQVVRGSDSFFGVDTEE
jgi:hypothetical protein